MHKTENALSLKKANAAFLGPEESQTWILVESYDPYNGGTNSPAPLESTNLLMFRNDGTMQERNIVKASSTQANEGKWLLNKEKTMLATDLLGYQLSEFRIRYQKIGSDTLVLSQQGRHGWVDKKYVLSSPQK